MNDLWPAPQASGPLSGTVRIPGSKSITNRALLLAALSEGHSSVLQPLKSRDTELMLAGLTALGAQLVASESGYDVTPIPSGAQTSGTVDCGLAGTVMRFLAPVAGLALGNVSFVGDDAASKRPMAPLLDGLRQLGVTTRSVDAIALPYEIEGHGGIPGGLARIDSSQSSQFVSALLLAGARFRDGLNLVHTGTEIPALPHIRMTIDMLAQHGVRVRENPGEFTWRVPAGTIEAKDRIVEPDLSNATPFWAAAMVAGGSVRVPGLGRETLQPLGEVIDVFTALGADIEVGTNDDGIDEVRVTGTGQLNGIDRNVGAIGELTPTIAALCALAAEPSHLRGIAHLAGHESDRLAALENELERIGGRVKAFDDGLEIQPATYTAREHWRTYHDHRMATAGAILGLAVPGLHVENIATTSKTFPTFAAQWRELIGPA